MDLAGNNTISDYHSVEPPQNQVWASSYPIFTADQQMRMDAVNAAIQLYGNKQAPHLESYNENFKKLYTEIYNFYVSK